MVEYARSAAPARSRRRYATWASRCARGLHTGEVVVPRTTRELVAGSDVAFDARGPAALKDVPGEWELYAVRQ